MLIDRQISVALLFFFIAASLGVLLRSLHVFDLGMNYRFIVHGHSHIALLGWVYLSLTAILIKLFVPLKEDLRKRYSLILYFTLSTILGMLFTFPFQGYAFLSILFSTLFLFASYVYARFFFKHISPSVRKLYCYPYIKSSLYFMLLSSLGPWALGGIMATLGSSSDWYRIAIYFYLHFQYNGWMILVLVGLFIYALERKGITPTRNGNRRFFWLLNMSVVLTFFLSTLWTMPMYIVFVISLLGALIQFILFFYAVSWLKISWKRIEAVFTALELKLILVVGLFLGAKLFLQIIGSIPYFANAAASIIELTIAYLHLIFLGVVSLAIFLMLRVFELAKITAKQFNLYLVGFVLTEGLIVFKGMIIWSGSNWGFDTYEESLMFASVILLAAIGLIFIKNAAAKEICYWS